MKLLFLCCAFVALLAVHVRSALVIVDEYEYDEDVGITNATLPTTEVVTTETTQDSSEFDGISFLYGALAGVGGLSLIVAVCCVLRVKKNEKKLRSFELNTYVNDDVA